MPFIKRSILHMAAVARGITTNGVVTCPKQLRQLLLDALGFDDEVHNVIPEEMCKIYFHDEACYVPGKGFQGVRLSLPLAHAYRIMDVYDNHSQPIVNMVSVFNPGENLEEEEYDAIREKALQDKARVMRMTQKALIDKESDVSQFFAHYGKMSDTRNMYTKHARHSGAMCIWSAPDVSPTDLSEIQGMLGQISELNGGIPHVDGSIDMCDDIKLEDDGYEGDAMGHQVKAGSIGNVMRSEEDEGLHSNLLSMFSNKVHGLRTKADDFNRCYAFSLCDALKIPSGSIADDKWRKLYTTTACALSNLSVEGDRLVASMNENHCKDGNAVVFHSPESGSTLYKLNAGTVPGLRVASSMGRYIQQRKQRGETVAGASRGDVMPHGIQIPPAIDGISSNRYVTNEDAGSYAEDMVHRDAWVNSSAAHHMSSELYLSGAPHPVHKGGIVDESGLRLFLNNLVLDDEADEADKKVYVPDKNQVVCDIVRQAHPQDWLDVITSDASVKDSSGSIIGWNIPLDRLRAI